MRLFGYRLESALLAAFYAVATACTSDPASNPGTNGGSSPQAGNPTRGGAQNSGDQNSGAQNSGATAGSSAGGTSSSSGGALGGAASGSAAGGTSGVGAAAGSAGIGAAGSGGNVAGAANSGGTSGAGGSVGSGGSAASGSPSTGGRLSSGGSGTGAAAASGGGNAAGGGSGGAGSGWLFPASVTKPKLMIVGDSISAGPGCYKKYLVQNLKDNQITNYEFVGQYTDDCGAGVKHSAVSCSTAAQYTEATFTVPNCKGETQFPGMSTLMSTHKPDMVMIQLGVNDIWSGNTPVSSVLSNYEKLVQQARAQNPSVVLVVAQIHKIITDNCQNMASTKNAEELVMAVPGWAAKLSTQQSPVLTADLWTNSDAHESEDCVHPNEAGAQRMGLNWYNAIKGILKP